MREYEEREKGMRNEEGGRKRTEGRRTRGSIEE